MGKKLMVLGRKSNIAECSALASYCLDRNDLIVCDFSDHYQLNRQGMAKAGNIAMHLDLSELFRQVENDLHDKYIDFIAEWPDKKLFKGKCFKELFVWRGISLWWFSQPARKAVGEYGEFTKLVELFTIMAIIKEQNISHVELVSCPGAFEKILSRRGVSIKSRMAQNGGGPLKWALERCRIFLRAIEIRSALRKSNTIRSSAKKYQLISWFPFNWTSRDVDRMYAGLADSAMEEIGWCFIAAGVQKIRELPKLAEKVKQLYPKAGLCFVQSLVTFMDAFRLFADLSNLIRFVAVLKTSGIKSSMMLNGVDVFPVFEKPLLRSFFVDVYEAQLLSVAFENYSRSSKNVFISYGDFFPIGRAMIHGVRISGAGSEVVWHQHAMHSKGKLIYVNRPRETNMGESLDSVKYFPVADRYLLWGRQALEQVKPFYPESRAAMVGSYKYDSLCRPPGRETVRQGKCRVLIAPSNTRSECLFLFHSVREAIGEDHGKYEVFASMHPVLDKRLFENDLSSAFDGRAKVFPGSTIKAILDCDLAVVGVSTIVLDAMLMRKPVVVCRMPNDIYYGIDPADGIDIVSEPSELREKMRYHCSVASILSDRSEVLLEELIGPHDGRVKERFWKEVG